MTPGFDLPASKEQIPEEKEEGGHPTTQTPAFGLPAVEEKKSKRQPPIQKSINDTIVGAEVSSYHAVGDGGEVLSTPSVPSDDNPISDEFFNDHLGTPTEPQYTSTTADFLDELNPEVAEKMKLEERALQKQEEVQETADTLDEW